MKILVLSDLHLELGTSLTLPSKLTAADAFDVVVLAGDIHSPGHKAVHWAQRSSTFGGKPVVLVPGNHEFYGRLMPAELARMKEAALGSNVHLPGRAGAASSSTACVSWAAPCGPISSCRFASLLASWMSTSDAPCSKPTAA